MATSLFGVGEILNANVNGTIVPQSFTGTAGQTVFNLTNYTYTPGTNSLEVYINGSLQRSGRDYSETSSTSFTLFDGVIAGDLVDSYGIPFTVVTAFPASYAQYTAFVGGASRNVSDKLGEFVSIKDAGAVGDGVAIDDVAWDKAITYLNTLPYGGTLYFPPSTGGYKFSTIRTWNPNKICIDFGSNFIDFSSIVGYCIKFQQTSTDANFRQGLNRAHPMRNGILFGGGGAALQTCIQGVDNNLIGGVGWLPGVSLQGIAFYNFYRDIEYGIGAFLWNHINCNFAITSGAGYDVSLYSTAAANSGENHSYHGCFWSKVSGSILRQLNNNASFNFYGCSADYTDNFFDAQGGSVIWYGYIESNRDVDYFAKVTGQNTLLEINGPVVVTGNKSLKELFYVDATSANGGLVGNISLQFSGGVAYTNLALVAGTGRTVIKYKAHSRSTVHPAVGGAQTVLYNGGFEIASLGEWVLTGTTPPSISTVIAHSGTHSLLFAGAPGNTPGASSKNIPCTAGQFIVGGLWYNTANLTGTAGTLFITTNYLDVTGTVALLSQATLALTVNSAGWVYLNLGTSTPAPAGTWSAGISISIFGVGSGTPNVYVDDVTLCVA